MAPTHLDKRVDRLEARQSDVQDTITSQLARADAVIEDLIGAIEQLRVRVEQLEHAARRP